MNNKSSLDFKNYLQADSYSKGWGKEYWLFNNENLCCKVLRLEKNKQCSLHFHLEKEEIFFVIEGQMALTWIDTQTGAEHLRELSKGDSVFISRGMPHSFCGMSDEPCLFLEASTHHEEHDSYRVRPGDSQKL
ncbi:MAG: cupin domain-containing protein [Gammaproteobacteria bacterium]|nr:cupin domain-containing protein [Gammaproteobacteria bacterium]